MIAEIEWVDACLEEAQINWDAVELLVPIIRKNTGYLLVDKDDYVVVSFGKIDNIFKGATAYCETMSIPRGCIKNIKLLEGGE